MIDPLRQAQLLVAALPAPARCVSCRSDQDVATHEVAIGNLIPDRGSFDLCSACAKEIHEAYVLASAALVLEADGWTEEYLVDD